MAYGDKHPYKKDLKQFKTRGPAKSYPQEASDAARAQAAGKPAPPHNPELQAYAKGQVEDRAKRWVMGRHENQGRSPMGVLSSQQWSEFQQTGDVEGLWPGYGPQSQGPDDREWEPL